jgi:hypothetical protein
MDSDTIIAALGHSFEDEEVQALVKQLGMKDVPEAKPKEPTACLEAKNAGVQLTFTDGDFLAARKVALYGTADMIVTGATLYALNGEPGYEAFKGHLPKGTSLSDTAEELRAKLGPHEEVDADEGVVFARGWLLEGFQITFCYSPEGSPKYVQIILPRFLDRLRL